MPSTPPPLRVGTRASELALSQTGMVATALEAASGRTVELVRIRTAGDRSRASLAALGGTGVFAVALREALLEGRCDIAVHSLKDLPTAPAPGLTVAALPERADHRDVLCSREGWTLAGLPAGARVGTGSPRRAAQLRLARPDLAVVDLRGNVGTRLSRVGDDLDAVVLARAGLERLSLLDHVTETLAPTTMLPSPGQGALAVECRTTDVGDGPLEATMRALDHLPTRLAVVAERTLLGTLEAGCAAPVAAWGRVSYGSDGAPTRLELRAGAFAPDGGRHLIRTAGVDLPGDAANGLAAPTDGAPAPGTANAAALAAAHDLGISTAAALLADGAAEIAGLPRS
ncbi:MAG: hydroxymethylbilane synthase [Georgenia sp.]